MKPAVDGGPPPRVGIGRKPTVDGGEGGRLVFGACGRCEIIALR